MIVVHDRIDDESPDVRFGDDDVRLVEALAVRAAVAVDLSHRVEREALGRVVSAQETERRRIARELHDETGQALTSMLLGLRAAEKAKDDGARRAALASLRELATATLQDVRRLAVELRPRALDDFGLEPALERLIEAFRERSGLEAQFEARIGERLPSEIETALYRIVQEALTNVAKHARADHHQRAGRQEEQLGDGGDRGRRRRLLPGPAVRRSRARRHARTGRAARRTPRRRVQTRRRHYRCGRGARSVIRVLIVDDHAVVRSGLRLLLEQEDDIECVGEAADAEAAIREARHERPDVVVLDLVMPGKTGIEAAPAILDAAPEAKLLVLSMQDDPSYVRESFAVGAMGYILKEAAESEIVQAVREVAGGGRYVHPSLGARLVVAEAQARAQADADPLSDREREVLRLLALGHTNQEIAKLLFISVRTAETHRAHIMQKLRLSTRAELVRYAIANGLLEDEA